MSSYTKLSSLLCAGVLLVCACGEKAEPEPVVVDPETFSLSLTGTAGTNAYLPPSGEMSVFLDKVGETALYDFTNKSSLGKYQFEGTVNSKLGDHTLFGLCPSGSVTGIKDGNVLVEFDGSSEILLMDPYDITLKNASQRHSNVNFRHLGGIIKIVPEDVSEGEVLLDEMATSIKVETASYPIKGVAEVSLSDGKIKDWTDGEKSFSTSFSKDNSCIINGQDAIYIVAKPGIVAKGEKITVSITVDGHSASKTITLESDLKLNESLPCTISVKYSDEDIDQGGGGGGTSHKYAKWAEMPVIADENSDGIDDNNSSLYYACHSFTQGGKKVRNYTVCYDAEHICPLWISAPRHSCYSGSSGRTDAYKQDPDIPGSYQYVSKSTGGGCNKGHMLGSAERTCCAEANRQVFYYTNIAPQESSGFNTGGGGWNILEDWIDDQVPNDTLYVVIGTYFDSFTDGYGKTVQPKTIEFGGRDDVSKPTMFYYVLLRTINGNTHKNVKDCAAGELKCAAFVRSHTSSHKGQKVSSKDMMSVADLEKVTGVTYFPNVPNAPKTVCNPQDWGL